MNQQPHWPAQQQPQSSQKMSLPRINGRIFLKILLYFIGAFIAEVGVLGASFGATPSGNTPFGCIASSFGILGLVGSIFIFFQKKYHIHCLLGLQYLWWILGTTAVFFVAFVLVFSLTKPTSNPIASALAGSVLFFYGVFLMWIAHLKPSIAQQVNESVYRILKTMPGSQMVISDLLARLQGEYKQLGSTIHQYLGNLEYIEQVAIPGAPGMVCRMKQPKPPVMVPPMQSVPISTPYPQMTSAPQSSPILVQQISRPPVVQSKFPQSVRPNDAFRSLADQKTAAALPIPNLIPPVQPAQNILPQQPKPVDVPVPPVRQTILPPPSAPAPPKPSTSLPKEPKAIQIFCCYAHKDEQRLKKLKDHLKPQQRQGFVHIWHDRDISAGTEWEQEIEEQLNTAQIILLLVSADFMASDYCYSKEMQRALERHSRGEARTIPIILRPTDWRITPLGKLQALPKDGKPITTWSNQDDAYLNVARGIRAVVETLLKPSQQPGKEVAVPKDAQKPEAEVVLIRTRCTQGDLIVTNRKIVIALHGLGQTIKSQTLLTASLSSVDSKLAVPAVFGKGGGINLTFRGRGREVLNADLVPIKEAKEIVALLSQ